MKRLLAVLGTASSLSLITLAHAQDSQFESELLTAPGPAAVEQQTLVAAAPSASGVLPQAEGGLGIDLWQSANTAQISQLLAGVDVEQLSPAGQSILSRLLLSEAHPPADATQEFLSLRLSLLARIGDLPGVAALSERALRDQNSLSLSEGMISAHLLDGGLNTGCDAITRLPVTQKQGAHWARLDAVCHEREGRSLQAELSLELGADASEPDPLFDMLYLALGGNSSEPILPTGAAQQHPFSAALHLALIREVGLDPSIAGANIDNKISLRTIARSKGAPIDQRILAAEKALTLGHIKVEELANLYALTQSGLNTGDPSAADASADLQAAAIQYQKVRAALPGREKATAIATALASAQSRGQFTAAAYLYSNEIIALNAGTANQIDAAIIARALLSIGAFLEAKPWFMVTYQSARDRVPGSFEQLGTVWPLIAMAGEGTAPRGIQRLAGGWLTSLVPQEDATKRKQAVLLFTLLEGYARPVEEQLWDELYPAPNDDADKSPALHLVDQTLWRGMEAAAARGERGKAISLMVRGLSEARLRDHHPAYLASTVGILTALGLEAEGHKLAVEALLAAGF